MTGGVVTFGSVSIPLSGQYKVTEPLVINTETNIFGSIINNVQYINKNVQSAILNGFTVEFEYTSQSANDAVVGALLNLATTVQTLTLADGRVVPYMKLNPITGPREVGKGVYKYTLSFVEQTA